MRHVPGSGFRFRGNDNPGSPWTPIAREPLRSCTPVRGCAGVLRQGLYVAARTSGQNFLPPAFLVCHEPARQSWARQDTRLPERPPIQVIMGLASQVAFLNHRYSYVFSGAKE